VAKAIGSVLRQARLDAGMSHRDLAKATGLTLGQISQVESGVRKQPSFQVVALIAKATSASLDRIAAACGLGVAPDLGGGAPTSAQTTRRIEKAQRTAQALADDLAAIAARRTKR
jgi:transcriptional regulator with XRE-family HTH domain